MRPINAIDTICRALSQGCSLETARSTVKQYFSTNAAQVYRFPDEVLQGLEDAYNDKLDRDALMIELKRLSARYESILGGE